ncbi:hypothetical protein D3C80_1686220 [compost metagenome]
MVPGEVGQARQEVGGIACFQHRLLTVDLDRQCTLEDEEHLLTLMGHGFAAVARRRVHDGAAQNAAGKGSGQAFVGDVAAGRAGERIGAALIVAGKRRRHPRRIEECPDLDLQHPADRDQRRQ